MNILNRKRVPLARLGQTFTGSLLMAAMVAHSAEELDLSDVPLYQSISVEPNVFVTLDDSNSMLAGLLLAGSDTGIYEAAGSYNHPVFGPQTEDYYYDQVIPSVGGVCHFTVPPEAMYETGQPYTGLFLDPATNDFGFWRMRNPSYNYIYYNPKVTYTPWSGTDAGGDALYSVHLATAAPEDPTDPDGTTRDLTLDVACTFTNPHSGRTDIPPVPVGVNYGSFYPARYWTWYDTNGDNLVDATDEHCLVEIKLVNGPFGNDADAACPNVATDRGGRTDCASAPSCRYDEEIQNFSNWYTYYRRRLYTAQGALGNVIDGLDYTRLGLWLFDAGLVRDVASMSDATNKRTLLQDIYAISTSTADTATRTATIQVGEYFKSSQANGWTPIQSAADGGSCQRNFNLIVTDGYWNCTTSVAGGCTTVADYVTNNGLSANIIADNDSTDDTAFDDPVYNDGGSGDLPTLADIVMYYYENDLVGALTDQVPILTGVDEAEHQHLVTYGIAIGPSGSLDPEGNRTPADDTDTDPNAAGFAWPAVTADDATTIDDLWHATFNSRGEFYTAGDAESLVNSLEVVFTFIEEQTGSGTSVNLSSAYLGSGTLAFSTLFSTDDWSGQVLAYQLDGATGAIGAPIWDANCKLTGGFCDTTGTTETGQNWNTGREILTSTPPAHNDNGAGVAFRWPANPASPTASEITAAQTDALRIDPDNPGTPLTAAEGQSRLEFTRGRTGIAGLRSRDNLLGDIVNSTQVYVGVPGLAYPDYLEAHNYSAFVSAQSARTPVIYVGANDGMLHGFDASVSGGEELIAYVPSEVYSRLSGVASATYGSSPAHHFMVDGPPRAGDVYFNGAWRTILVGGLGRGGQGIYALDITNPTNFDESNASSLVLWEFSDASDTDSSGNLLGDLGYTYGRPEIVRLHYDESAVSPPNHWGVVIGNGFNSTEDYVDADSNGYADTEPASSTGNAVIYILDAEDGSVIRKFDTGVGTADDPYNFTDVAPADGVDDDFTDNIPNGIKEVSVADVDGDRIADYIFAGDLFGNLWKIDIRDEDAANWDFALGGVSPVPLFTAKDSSGNHLPITSKIEVGLHPYYSGQILYFGTGKHLETTDHSQLLQNTQSFFGIWDRNETGSGSTITRSHLRDQQIIYETAFDATTDVRLTSNNAMLWFAQATGLPSNPGSDTSMGEDGFLGWRMDLINTGAISPSNEGERVVTNPLLRDGIIIFTTLIPSGDPCEAGGDSWLMQLDAFSGGRLSQTPFDLNGDGTFDTDDFADDASGNATAVSGVKSGVGILPLPGYATGEDRYYRYDTGSSGEVEQHEEQRRSATYGRQSWRQIK